MSSSFDKLLSLSTDGEASTLSHIEAKRPSLYKVVLLNDDFTPMFFVVEILQKFFSKDRTSATEIMLNVHNKGKAICGVYTYDVAETKVFEVNEYSRQNDHPLKCILEKN